MTMVFGRNSARPWDRWDRLLAEAYQILDSERCRQCGLPKYVCNNPSEKVQFRFDEEQCGVVAAEARQTSGKGGKKKEMAPGTRLVPDAYHVDGRNVDLASLRKPYYKDRSARRKEIDLSLWPEKPAE